MKHLRIYPNIIIHSVHCVGRDDFPFHDDSNVLAMKITTWSIALPEALQAANAVIFSQSAPEVILLTTSPFGAITHLPASVGKSELPRIHICEETNFSFFSDITFTNISQNPKTINGFEVADFRAENTILAFFKLILLRLMKLLTHILPGLLFLRGFFSLFDTIYSRTIL